MTTLAPSPTCKSGRAKAAEPRLCIAYLTSEYPKASHTFIRREIKELERRGHEILRLSIRKDDSIVDPEDLEEQRRTFHCFTQRWWRLIVALFATALRSPIRFINAAKATLRMHNRSDRGIIAHLAYLAEASLLTRIVRRRQVSHLHVHFGANAAAVARLMRLLGGPPYSLTVHGPNEFDAIKSLSLPEKIADAEFVVAISHFAAAQLYRWSPRSAWKKIRIVRCTVDERHFAPVEPIPADSNLFLCIGRLSAQKGQHLLIDAMQQLVGTGVKAQLVLAGDGEMREEIERHIREADLCDVIQVTGWVSEDRIRELIERCRALVQPSFAEGLPVAIMEGFAAGRPVISTWVAGIPELVKSGENGWLIPPGSIDDLVDAMRDAMAATSKRLNDMGRRGRDEVRRRHSAAQEISQLEQLFVRSVRKMGKDASN